MMPVSHFAPHLHGGTSVPTLMLKVLLALVPAAVVHIVYFGIGLILNICIAVVTALVCEAVVLRLRDRPVASTLRDFSAVITAVLIAFAVPPLTPWWITMIAVLFAIVFAKHLYGGLGNNIFNPAMAGYLVVFISFPEELARWPIPKLDDLDQQTTGITPTITYFFTGQLPAFLDWSAISGATPLDRTQTELGMMRTMTEIQADPIFDSMTKSWAWINLAALAGGLWLLQQRAIQWHIPVGLLGGLFFIAVAFYITDSDLHPSPVFELLCGGTMIGAFFIATDPVSAAATPRGRLLYGAGIGILVYVIRQWGSYPDGFAFAVLLMNLAVPLIDRLTKPRIYGRR